MGRDGQLDAQERGALQVHQRGQFGDGDLGGGPQSHADGAVYGDDGVFELAILGMEHVARASRGITDTYRHTHTHKKKGGGGVVEDWQGFGWVYQCKHL